MPLTSSETHLYSMPLFWSMPARQVLLKRSAICTSSATTCACFRTSADHCALLRQCSCRKGPCSMLVFHLQHTFTSSGPDLMTAACVCALLWRQAAFTAPFKDRKVQVWVPHSCPQTFIVHIIAITVLLEPP